MYFIHPFYIFEFLCFSRLLTSLEQVYVVYVVPLATGAVRAAKELVSSAGLSGLF